MVQLHHAHHHGAVKRGGDVVLVRPGDQHVILLVATWLASCTAGRFERTKHFICSTTGYVNRLEVSKFDIKTRYFSLVELDETVSEFH